MDNEKSKGKCVSVGKCIFTIIGALIGLCACFIPFSIGTEAGIVYTYKLLPIAGDSSFLNYGNMAVESFCSIIPQITPDIEKYIETAFKFSVYGYFIILAADIALAFLLAIFRLNLFRILCRIFSILAGFAMLIIMLSFIVYIIGMGYMVLTSGQDILNGLKTLGFISALGITILSGIFIGKQFRWFTLPD